MDSARERIRTASRLVVKVGSSSLTTPQGMIDVDRVETLRERALRHVAIVFAEPVDTAELAALDGVHVQHAEKTSVRLTASETAMDGLVKAAARHRVLDLVSEPADLEEIFLELYREAGDGR